jgi:AraC-like DNA-binding protein
MIFAYRRIPAIDNPGYPKALDCRANEIGNISEGLGFSAPSNFSDSFSHETSIGG